MRLYPNEGETFLDFSLRLKPSLVQDAYWLQLKNDPDFQNIDYQVIAERASQMNLQNLSIDQIEPNKPALIQLAHDSGLKSGKWMLKILPAKVDEIWQKIAVKLEENFFGVATAKCSTEICNEAMEEPYQFTICLYCKDFTNTNHIFWVRQQLSELEIEK